MKWSYRPTHTAYVDIRACVQFDPTENDRDAILYLLNYYLDQSSFDAGKRPTALHAISRVRTWESMLLIVCMYLSIHPLADERTDIPFCGKF